MPETLTGYIGLGSNLGDRLGNLQRATEMLQATHGLRLTAASSIYESPPWGYTSPHPFLNAVLAVAWEGSPLGLRQACYRIEAALGRHDSGAPRGVESQEAEQYTDRTIDLDLLWLDGVEAQDPRLVLPHPLAHQRAFVLIPWSEIAPQFILQQRPLLDWLAELPRHEVEEVRLIPTASLLRR